MRRWYVGVSIVWSGINNKNKHYLRNSPSSMSQSVSLLPPYSYLLAAQTSASNFFAPASSHHCRPATRAPVRAPAQSVCACMRGHFGAFAG